MYILKATKGSKSFYLDYSMEGRVFSVVNTLEEALKFDDDSIQVGYILEKARKIFSDYGISSVSFPARLLLNPENNVYKDLSTEEMPEDMKHFCVFGTMP